MDRSSSSPSPSDPDLVPSLAAAWAAAERVVVLTGAGISTASGIADFRSPGGRWESYQPVTLQAFQASRDARAEYWRYKGETWQVIARAQPNPAHRALVELAEAGRVDLLVTQNVDGLHERSGFPAQRLVNIHGTDSRVVCMRCGERSDRAMAQAAWEAGDAVPSCACGGPLKPATISFGQSLVEDDLRRAFEAAGACDLLVVVGTSLLVSPINQLMPIALQGGAKTAIATASETPWDRQATWRSREPVEVVLPAVAEQIRSA